MRYGMFCSECERGVQCQRCADREAKIEAIYDAELQAAERTIKMLDHLLPGLKGGFYA